MLGIVFIWFVIGILIGWTASESLDSPYWLDKTMVIVAGFLGAVTGGLAYQAANLPYDLLVGSSASAFALGVLFAGAAVAARQRIA